MIIKGLGVKSGDYGERNWNITQYMSYSRRRLVLHNSICAKEKKWATSNVFSLIFPSLLFRYKSRLNENIYIMCNANANNVDGRKASRNNGKHIHTQNERLMQKKIDENRANNIRWMLCRDEQVEWYLCTDEVNWN